MEKNNEGFHEQILHLKKSHKNKRKGEIWEKVLDFYRNHQGALSNLQTLKLIKIALKPLITTTKTSCRHATFLSSASKRTEELESCYAGFKQKKRALEIMFDCYTLILEAYLQAADPHYFNAIFQPNYYSTKEKKELLFEPSLVNYRKEISKQSIEHQLKSYFRFICELSLCHLAAELCFGSQSGILSALKKCDNIIGSICSSSSHFVRKKVELQILKLNVREKGGVDVLSLKYEFPLEIIYQIYKSSPKWDQQRRSHHLKLICKYIYMVIKNSIYITFSPQQFETEIYALWKQVQIIRSYAPFPLTHFQRKLFEFMSVFSQIYEKIVSQGKELRFFIIQAGLQQIRPLEDNEELHPEEMKGPGILQKNVAPDSTETKKIMLKVCFQTNNKSSESKQLTKDFPEKFSNLVNKISSGVFDLIEQSDSDSEGNLQYQFERQRLREFSTNTCKAGRTICNNAENATEQDSVDIKEKFSELLRKTEDFKAYSQAAIGDLHKRRASLNQFYKVSNMDSLLSSPQKMGISFKQKAAEKSHFHLQLAKQEPRKFLSLSLKQGEQEEPKQKFKSITLHEKYDRMSQMILLSNTSKETPFDI